MADEHFKSQGTHLFFVDKITDPATPAVLKLECPTGIPGVNAGAKTKIPTTCLDELKDETSTPGLGSPTNQSIPFILRKAATGQRALFSMKENGETVSWMVGLSDGSAAPTLTGETLTPPADRTCAMFEAYVEDVSFDVAVNDVVKGTLILQRSGGTTMKWKV